jgi:hypothetical protein
MFTEPADAESMRKIRREGALLRRLAREQFQLSLLHRISWLEEHEKRLEDMMREAEEAAARFMEAESLNPEE